MCRPGRIRPGLRICEKGALLLRAGGDGISLPKILQSFGKSLLPDGAVHMDGVASEDELVVIALGGQYLGHALVGYDPVVHVVAHDVGIEEILVADFHPDVGSACAGSRDEVFMKFPGAVRRLRIRAAIAG